MPKALVDNKDIRDKNTKRVASLLEKLSNFASNSQCRHFTLNAHSLIAYKMDIESGSVSKRAAEDGPKVTVNTA